LGLLTPSVERSRFVLIRLAATALAAAAGIAVAAAAVEGPVAATENVEARLVAEVEAAAPGSTILVGLHKIIRPHWHTYWRNPGDAGEPTTLTFTAPEGVRASDFIWPLPTSIRVADVLLNYGYEGELLLPAEITVPADAQPGDTLALQGRATWLVCELVCIPEEVSLSLDLPIADAAVEDRAWGATLQDMVAAAPRPLGFEARLERAGEKVRLTVADPILAAAVAGGAIRDVEFFPFDRDVVVPAAEQVVRYAERGIEITLTPNFGLVEELRPVGGVIAFEEHRGEEWARRGVEIAASVGAAEIGAFVAMPRVPGGGLGGGLGGGGGLLGFVQAVLFAVIGGLILNLMPCVFPVLSMKALGVIEHAHGERAMARRHGLAFLGGVLSTFAVLALVLIALKAAGAQLGWGFQLQSPAFVTAVALLFFAIGLNLLGVFEVGASLQNLGGRSASLSGPAGSFAVGALAVAAASPCTAPFMSAALPVALAAPAPAALLIFLALGVGFAAPFTALSFFPGWARILPKPGVWMERLKQLLAFPMFAAAAWLLWVLGAQTGPNGVLAALALMMGLGFAVWTFRTSREASARVKGAFRVAGLGALAAVVLLVGGAYGSGALAPAGGASPTRSGAGLTIAAEDVWSPERVAALRAEGRPVFVDFTAAWCVTCQANKILVLRTERVRRAFAESDTAELVADWTNRDAAIAAELERYGRSGVPLYLLFPPEGEAIVLNEILTERHLIDALARAAAS
jgi:thiol:disulfide interchange protein DsbD